MQLNLASQAQVYLNVRVVTGKPNADGSLDIRTDRRFKNTATRLMTESICNYLVGAENTYRRGKGRPNYMGIGTMGIAKQNNLEAAEVVDTFSDKTYEEGETTRPWFGSTSLALTNVCGAENPDEHGVSHHFWDPYLGWGKDGFTGEPSDEPIFQGELCTSRLPRTDAAGNSLEDWEPIERLPILRSEVLSDCPADWDYGTDGYCSQAIFYGYASVGWVHKLLHPTHGPQLDRMAISEFGLYEKNNTDPHGLETMLAGFRVPTEEDLVYVTDGEVILIEWRVTVRALMPSEGVRVVSEPAPTGIHILAAVIDEHNVQLSAVVRGEAGVSQSVSWGIDNDPSTLAPNTSISETGLLHLDEDEQSDVIYVTASSKVDPWIRATTAVLTGLIKDLVTGISVTSESIDNNEIQLRATVLGKGTFLQTVTWSLDGNTSPGTTIDSDGLLTIDFDEQAEAMRVTATSTENTNVFSIAAVVRIDKTAGTYVISDFTILT